MIGTDLVLGTNSFDDLASLFQDCSEFLDKTTWTLIETLLFKQDKQALGKAIKCFELGPADLTGVTIRKVSVALNEDRNLGKWKKRFDYYLQKNPEECRHKFEVTDLSVMRENFGTQGKILESLESQ